MRLKLKHITLCLSMLALAACKESVGVLDPVEPTIPDSEKTPIELSVGGVDSPNPITRAVITDGTGKTLNAFDVDTKIFMVMKSEYGQTDYQGTHDTKYTVARGDVKVSENDQTNNRSIVKFDEINQRYWDDAHARSSQLDVWAYAQKGQSWTTCTFEVPNPDGTGIDAYKDQTYNTANLPTPLWSKGVAGEIYPAIRRWRASHYVDSNASSYRCQDKTTVECQDLLYSNNLTNNQSYNGIGGDNRLKFDFTNRLFPQVGNANMIFYHAMSKITIHIKKGDGFTDADPFAFTTGNVKLIGFNTEGLFNIKTGQFEFIHERYDIPSIYKWETPSTGDAHTLEALVIPNVDGNADGLTDTYSRLVDNATAKSMEFVIDGNKFEISQDQLYEALKAKSENSSIVSDGRVNLEAGKNYVFTFVVGKTKIKNITAQVADWEDVEAENISPTNARIKLQLEERGTEQITDVAIYKANDNKTSEGIDDNYATYNWKTGYANLEATYSTDHWTTNYFWESSKDFYHFRALMPDEIGITTDGSGDGDYATLTSGASYTDVLWGAPMLDDGDNETQGTFKWNYGPTMNGFDGLDTKAANAHQIYKAIGPTEDPVKLILFHIMSDLTFNIITTSNSDKVELCHQYEENGETKYKRTRLDLVGFYNGGKVLLGSGLVMTSRDGNVSTITNPVNIPFASATDGAYTKQVYTFGAVPQNLAKETVTEKSEDVKLYITTPDDNQYIVDLKDVVTSTIATNNLANPYKKIDAEGPNKGKYQLNRWYPGFKYNYTFKLTKKGIEDIQATIVPWETVEAEQDPVQIR